MSTTADELHQGGRSHWGHEVADGMQSAIVKARKTETPQAKGPAARVRAAFAILEQPDSRC
jgi:hypothetical protein